MSEYATKGAMLTCTCGAAPSQLQVTSNTLYSVQGNMVATVSDKVPNTNIMPFGVCSVTQKPCKPSPIMWSGFITSVEIPGGNPLLKTSMLQCALGGSIKFQNSGQMKSDKVVLNPDSPQIRALKKAAQEAAPFCEECEKKKAQKEPKILRIYWMDEQGEPRKLSELEEGKEVTLCIDVEEGSAGKTVNLQLNAEEGKSFKTGSSQLKYNGLQVEDDNTAYIDNFKLEYKD
ncbi:DUF4280 domain-containing protein [Dysgonomonas sp. ZJ279]|uniref:DUF4280 domain-containing protein n=1 Tax=Dysgonomonas sp. ZJ279 TaxID=2709796 RepID=UPI0013EB9B3B|nr:DUF4280 domain-containing protein [Dysgonomonas sp. ZJ279]